MEKINNSFYRIIPRPLFDKDYFGISFLNTIYVIWRRKILKEYQWTLNNGVIYCVLAHSKLHAIEIICNNAGPIENLLLDEYLTIREIK